MTFGDWRFSLGMFLKFSCVAASINALFCLYRNLIPLYIHTVGLEPMIMIILCLTFSGIVKLVSFSPHFYLHIYRIHCTPKYAIVCGITFNAWSLI